MGVAIETVPPLAVILKTPVVACAKVAVMRVKSVQSTVAAVTEPIFTCGMG